MSIDSLAQSIANNLTDFAKTAQGIAALAITAIAGTIHITVPEPYCGTVGKWI